jgi:hypothetical protein
MFGILFSIGLRSFYEEIRQKAKVNVFRAVREPKPSYFSEQNAFFSHFFIISSDTG